jgi:hypothetical protein
MSSKLKFISMKKLVIYLFLVTAYPAFSQDEMVADDVKLAGKSEVGQSANVNQSTGKVNESYSVTDISCRAVSYNVAFNYDGANVFKQAQFQNRYFNTGILGVGWNMGTPKIYVDTKETAARDDDDFFLNGIEIICTKRPLPTPATTGIKIWEFKAKKLLPFVIKYYEKNITSVSPLTTTILDYWEVIDDKGKIYIYGNSDNTRENVLAWGNWIGDTRLIAGAATHTITWNLAQLKDQWNNTLSFTYQKIEQGVNTTGPKHTEASYLKQVDSGTGEKIVFNYLTKNTYEYYEPNIEMVEPDAYQERYEKLYLSSVEKYNSANELVTNHQFTYQIATTGATENNKRYLTQITVKNAQNNNLPAQQYEYFTTGTFAGGLKKSTNMKGGSINYTYEEKTLWTNTTPGTYTTLPLVTPYTAPFGNFDNDNYKLMLLANSDELTSCSQSCERNVHFAIRREHWNGRAWIPNNFIIPEVIRTYTASSNISTLKNVKFIFKDNFYAILVFDRSTGLGTLHTFKQLDNGTWYYTSYGSLATGGDNGNYDKDPVLMAGNDFLTVAVQQTGRLYTYVWNNSYWKTKTIEQGAGNYFFGNNDNFIIAQNTVSGLDMANMAPTDTQSNYDRYYCHYLDAEKEWRTKSWTNTMTATVGDVSQRSYFYPSNSTAAFVAGSNPEYLIRWDPEYNLTTVVGGLGSFSDTNPFMNIGNSLFLGLRMYNLQMFRSAAISGLSNIITPEFDLKTQNGFSKNRLLGNRWNGIVDDYSNELKTFNPNFSIWQSVDLTMVPQQFPGHYSTSYAFANDFFMSGHHIYKLTNNGYTVLAGPISVFNYPESTISGGEYILSTFWSPDDEDIATPDIDTNKEGETKYFYVDKKDGTLKTVMRAPNYINLYLERNINATVFGGNYPFYTPKNFRGQRLINNLYNNVITDIVVKQIGYDNSMGLVSNITFTYENSHTTPDDNTVIYGTVTIQEMGAGSASNGYIKKYFDNGSTDFTRSGLLTKEEYFHSQNYKLKEINYNYTKSSYAIYNSASNNIYNYGVWYKASMEEKLFSAGTFTILTNYQYDANGNVSYTYKTNSEGKTESTTIIYADAQYPFVKDKNLLGFMYKKTNRVDSAIISVEQINWLQNGNNVYISDNLSGISDALLRTNDNKVEVVDAYGNIVETSNAKGISRTVLMGYNNKYPVATIVNSKYTDAVAALQVTYANLQTLSGAALKTELLKLYTYLPNALITLTLYDNNGNKVTNVDQRKNETNFSYDEFQRAKYTTDKNGNVMQHIKYNYKN